MSLTPLTEPLGSGAEGAEQPFLCCRCQAACQHRSCGLEQDLQAFWLFTGGQGYTSSLLPGSAWETAPHSGPEGFEVDQ